MNSPFCAVTGVSLCGELVVLRRRLENRAVRECFGAQRAAWAPPSSSGACIQHPAQHPAPVSVGAWQWKGIWEAQGAVLCSAPGAVQLRRLHFIKTVKQNN